jgi:hypothetical protein
MFGMTHVVNELKTGAAGVHDVMRGGGDGAACGARVEGARSEDGWIWGRAAMSSSTLPPQLLLFKR